MKTADYVVMGKPPTHEDWARAKDLLLKEILRSSKQANFFVEPCFSRFMICVLFLLEKVGVQKLMSANDTMRCLERIYNKNGLFYPSKIFRGAWSSIDSLDVECSTAELFLEQLKGTGVVRSSCGREIILLEGLSEGASEEHRLFRRDLWQACCIFGLKDNQKYISQISWVAYDLLMAMREKN